MKPELTLTARSTWRDPAPEKPAGPGRSFWAAIGAVVSVACLAFLLSSGQLRAPAAFGPYSVSVPLTFRTYDPARWAIMNAEDYQDALKIDPTLPDPASVGYADAAAAPPADPALLREEAFVGPPAKSYVFRGVTALDRERAHYCLTAAIYYEAASETDDGMRGVAQTVINRVRHPSFPNTVCGVVFQGSQRRTGTSSSASATARWRVCAQQRLGRPGQPHRLGGAGRLCLSEGRPRDPLSHPGDLAALGQEPGDDQHRRRPYLSPLARPLGMPDAFRAPYLGREPVPGPYLPLAQQLAILKGQGLAPGAGPVPILTGPAAILPDMAAAPLPGAMAPAAPIVPPPATPAAPTYADPRLNQSGQVREEFRGSGEWKR